jgi:hypothetical protein
MKKFWLVLNTLCFSLILMVQAEAYLDPTVMTYTIQIVAGIVVAAGVVIGIWWRKAKKKVQDKLGIDENTRKEVEDDIVEFDEENKK